MYTGTFGQHVIRATHPFIVVESEKVCGSFSTLEAAEEFIAKQGSYSAFVLRHNRRRWVPAEYRRAKLLPHNSVFGLCREGGFQGLPDLALISRIQEALQKYPHLTYTAGAHHLEVPAQTRNGFRVWIRQRSDHYTVGFERWQEEFTDAASALNCFNFGLSVACRLRVLNCGGVDYKWQVQRQLGGQWVTVNEIGMVLFPFWCKRRERFLQNDIIKAT